MDQNKDHFILFSSFVIAALLIIISCTGLFIPDFYSRETANWQAQSIGQDMVDLFLIIPVLIATTIFAFKKNSIALLFWGAVLLYLVYTFTIYCFDLHFNQLFIIYCSTLGLSLYSFIYFLFLQIKQPVSFQIKTYLPVKIAGLYFIIISILFYLLWLAEIVPPIIKNSVPKNLSKTGLLTNPVHVIDLSIFLPAIFITGMLLIRKNNVGYLLAPVMMIFFILMDITIGCLVIVMKIKGLEANLAVAVVMGLLVLWTLVLLIWYLKNISIARSDNES